jgi:hypothetical protein
MSTIGDWIRYSALSWLVWTDKPVQTVFWTLRSHLDHNDQILIAKLDLNDSFGSLSPWIWTWIRSKGQPLLTGNDLRGYLLEEP